MLNPSEYEMFVVGSLALDGLAQIRVQGVKGEKTWYVDMRRWIRGIDPNGSFVATKKGFQFDVGRLGEFIDLLKRAGELIKQRREEVKK